MGETRAGTAGPDPARVHSRTDLARELDLLRARAAGGTRKPRISLTDLAARVREPRSTVHAYVSGRHLPAADVLDRIVIALGASPTEQREWGEAWFRAAAARPSNATASGPGVPHQLVPDVDHFTGRLAELAALDRCLAAATRPEPAMTISAVAGAGGVGKSALVARWAHRVAPAFPDGQLWVDLRGYDREQPLAPGAALGGFLRALGMPAAEIPIDVDERAALYRSRLDGRRVLVVLDNARDTEQVRLLLPGSRSCLVLVTSRDSLSGLVARHGARRLELDVLPELDAVDLVDRLVGDRARAQAPDVATLVHRCGRLPLALRIAAELAVRRPGVRLGDLAAELADEHGLLDLLDAAGDQRTSVRAVLSWSYRHLDPDTARAFRLLGLIPGEDIDDHAAAALFDTDPYDARRALAALTHAHLLGEPSPGRYALHDLLRAWAAEQVAVRDTDSEREAAVRRLFDHYVDTAAVAAARLDPSSGGPRMARRGGGDGPADEAAARAWLDAERANLSAVSAAHEQWPVHAIDLSAVLEHDLRYRGHLAVACSVHTNALAAARSRGDRPAQLRVLVALGTANRLAGRHEPAREHFSAATALARLIGDRRGEARALGNLGIATNCLGRPEEALGMHERARAIFRELGDRLSEALALTNLGAIHGQTGDNTKAAGHHRRSLAIARDLGNRDLEANALNNLGVVLEQTGRHAEAADRYSAALTLHRDLGDHRGEVRAVVNLADLAVLTGDHEQAVARYGTALELFRAVGDRCAEARTRANLARSCGRLGRRPEAEAHWRAAVDIYTELGLSDAADVRVELAAARSK